MTEDRSRDAATPDWLDHGRNVLARTALAPQAEAIGRVRQTADGIAHVTGLPDVRLNALLRFEGGQYGFAQALDRDEIAAVLLDDTAAVTAGQRVVDTGEVLQVPVGEALVGAGGRPAGATAGWPAPPWGRPRPGRSNARRPRSSNAIRSRTRSKPGCWWWTRCLPWAGASAS